MGDAPDERTKQAEDRLQQACSLDLTPPEIAERLSHYCIGQDAAVATKPGQHQSVEHPSPHCPSGRIRLSMHAVS